MISNIENMPEIKEFPLWSTIKQYNDWEYFWYGRLKNGQYGVAFRVKSDPSKIITFEVSA